MIAWTKVDPDNLATYPAEGVPVEMRRWTSSPDWGCVTVRGIIQPGDVTSRLHIEFAPHNALTETPPDEDENGKRLATIWWRLVL